MMKNSKLKMVLIVVLILMIALIGYLVYGYVQKANMTLNLVHETAHTFTMPEAYNNPGHDLDNGYVCVMEYFESSYAYAFYQDILDGTKQAFCSTCTSDIKNRALTSIVN